MKYSLLFLAMMRLGAQPSDSYCLDRVPWMHHPELRQCILELAPGTQFMEWARIPEPHGRVSIRLQQMHEGIPVWGTQAALRLNSEGGIQDAQWTLAPGIQLASGTKIGPDKALAEVIQELSLSFQAKALRAPEVREVVFPSKYQGGLVYSSGPEPGLFLLDPSLSVFADPPVEAFVPAYEVQTRHWDPIRGFMARTMIVHAYSGQILRKELGWHTHREQAIGASQFSGKVQLEALRLKDGRWALADPTRPTQPHAMQALILGEGEPASNTVFMRIPKDSNLIPTPICSANPTFGDGQMFNYLLPYGPELFQSMNAQTAAVDVAYGLQLSWDLYQKVLKRNGPQGDGKSLVAEVHAYLGPYSPYANASWDPDSRQLAFGDGGSGYLPFTALDIVAHEVAHAFMSSTANLRYSSESGGLNEANSDILGIATEFYRLGGGSGEQLPQPPSQADWVLGKQTAPRSGSSPAGFRSMKQPSLFSQPEYWYDGLSIYSDPHYSSGPANRFYYYLSMGYDPSDPTQKSLFVNSPFPGMGVHKALEIWVRVVTQLTDPGTLYDGMRKATETAAQALFGADAQELRTLRNAWAAVNVGPPDGQTIAPLLRVDPGPWPGGLSSGTPISSSSRDLFVGIGSAALLPKALADGFPTPPKLKWTSSFAQVDEQRGTIWPSIWNALGWSTSFNVEAVGTPYWAMAMLNPVVLDLDGDGEADASDAARLAIYAMTGYLPTETMDPYYGTRYFPPKVAIYRWNRAFQGLAATGEK